MELKFAEFLKLQQAEQRPKQAEHKLKVAEQ